METHNNLLFISQFFLPVFCFHFSDPVYIQNRLEGLNEQKIQKLSFCILLTVGEAWGLV